ncbi:helix-turn-helix domain-containing protein [Microbulbifer sp. TYP-18]|uniref:helix-turn-helix domain-containing protein n=1 Tax=Microbulbifer sp. TYP-18 TaxID=3230024 RepID=UPI0034C5B558
MKLIHERLKFARKEAGLTQGQLGKLCGGIKPQSISQWEDGKTKSPKAQNVLMVAQATGFAYEWLISGKGPMRTAGVAEKSGTYETNVKPGPEIRDPVPLISHVQAGEWGEVIDPYPPGQGEEMVNTISKVGPSAFALRVKGDSMTSPVGLSIPEGYIVIVDPDAGYENGSIVVAKLDNEEEAMLKKLVIDGPNRYLRALNPTYGPIEINGNCHIVGVVKDIILQV